MRTVMVFGILTLITHYGAGLRTKSTEDPWSYDNSWCFRGVYDYDNCPGMYNTYFMNICVIPNNYLAIDYIKP